MVEYLLVFVDIVKKDWVNINESKIIKKIRKNTKIEILAKLNNWNLSKSKNPSKV